MKLERLNVTNQVIAYLKQNIEDGIWKAGEKIPSENQLTKELGISRASVRTAIQHLAGIGVLESVHGKGTYVAAANRELLLEEQRKELEADLEQAIQKGRRYGISDEEIRSLFELILEG